MIIDLLLISAFIVIFILKIKQKKLNMMLNLYKTKHKIEIPTKVKHNSWNQKLAVVCSLFIVFNLSSIGIYQLKENVGYGKSVPNTTVSSSNSFGKEPGESSDDQDIEEDLSEYS
jgi:hypothetical protein